MAASVSTHFILVDLSMSQFLDILALYNVMNLCLFIWVVECLVILKCLADFDMCCCRMGGMDDYSMGMGGGFGGGMRGRGGGYGRGGMGGNMRGGMGGMGGMGGGMGGGFGGMGDGGMGDGIGGMGRGGFSRGGMR